MTNLWTKIGLLGPRGTAHRRREQPASKPGTSSSNLCFPPSGCCEIRALVSSEYSETQLKSLLATVDGWYEAFAKSPAFAGLSDSQQRKSGAITEFFARYTYEYLGLTPSEWEPGAVVECCTEILPRKISAENAFFEALAPVLSEFFHFLADQSLLPNGHVLAEAAEESQDDVVANAEDRSNWGPAKHFVMAARDAGVDIEDPAALQAYMVEFNMQMAARVYRSEAEPARAAQASSIFGRAPQAKEPKVRPSAGPYDPCPCGSGKKYKFCCQRRA